MLQLLRRFFMFLGVLFFIQVMGLGYLIIADPFQVRPLALMLWNARSANTTRTTEMGDTATVPPPAAGDAAVTPAATANTVPPTTPAATINADQAKALQSVGLDANAIANITPAQESCFVSILGAARVSAVKAGAVPTASEFFSVRSCL